MTSRTHERSKLSMIAATRAFRLAYGGDTKAGTMGRHNQDRIEIRHPEAPMADQKGSLLLVADGLGGYAGGEVASRMVCDELPRLYYAGTAADCRSNLCHAVQEMNDILFAASSASGEAHGMCTTLVAAAVSGDSVVIVHVGDSKGFLFRDGTITFATTDHCVRVPNFDSEEKRFLTQSLGAQPHIEPSCVELRLKDGDILLLCTDGLSDSLSLEEIIDKSMAVDPATAASNLVTAAQDQGGTDDVSVIVARVSAREPVELRD